MRKECLVDLNCWTVEHLVQLFLFCKLIELFLWDQKIQYWILAKLLSEVLLDLNADQLSKVIINF